MSLFELSLFLLILIISGIASYQDIKEQKVWIFLIILGISAAIVINIMIYGTGIINIILSASFYGFFYFVIKLVVKGKFGNGDIYFGIFQGACLSLNMLPECVLVEVFLALIIMNKKLKKGKFPFIPFMSGSLVLCFLQKMLF